MRFSEFSAGCKAQGVDIYSAYMPGPNPTPYYISCSIGDLLRAERPLSSDCIDPTFCQDDTVARTHVDIINSTHQSDLGDHLKFPMISRTVGHCRDAETRFARWLSGLAAGKPVGGRIVIDQDNSLVAVQKAVKWESKDIGASSVLLLKGVGVISKGATAILPAGSIVYAAFRGSGALRGHMPSLESVDKIQGMSFLRLSGFGMPTDYEWCEYMESSSPQDRDKFMHLNEATKVVAGFTGSVLPQKQ